MAEAVRRCGMSDRNIIFDDVSMVLLDVTDRTRKWMEQSRGCDIQEALGRMNQMAESGIQAANLYEMERAAGELAEAAAMAACVAIGFKALLRNTPPSEQMH